MTARISDIPTHNAAPGGTNKIESENPTGPTSEWSTLAEIFASLSYWAQSGGTVTYNGNVSAAGTITSTGANSALLWEDRTLGPTKEWAWFADSHIASLYSVELSTSLLSVDATNLETILYACKPFRLDGTLPVMQFTGVSGATKVGETYQQGDIHTLSAAAGVGNFVQVDLTTGNVTFNNYTTPGYLHVNSSGNIASQQPATFYAYMSTPQTVALSATDKLVLNSLISNGGGYFDSVTNHRWTPPAGPVSLYGQALATSFTATDSYLVIIAKNGATLAQRVFGAKPGFMDGAITAFDTANGTDYYELFVSTAAASSSGVTVNDFSGNTFFTGVALG